ncbi:MAG: Ig-like domain-containing protein [Candidatus Eisenbacteria bacterium]
MRWTRVAHLLSGAIAGVALLFGVWQCAEQPTSSLPGSLHLNLRAAVPPAGSDARFDSIEIEILRGGRLQERHVVVPDTSGAFRTLLALPAEETYSVRVYAWGQGSEPWPAGEAEIGVVAAGAVEGLRVPAGGRIEARVDLRSTEVPLLGVDGSPGVPQLHAWWRRVALATGYRLVWFALPDGPVVEGEAVADTQVVQSWEETRMRASADSVLFRVRPSFGARTGAATGGLWRDLATWLDLPHLLAARPDQGATVAIDELAVELDFDRPIAESSLPAGILWTRADGEPVDHDAGLLGDGRTVRLEPAAALSMGTGYRVRVTAGLRDLVDRPFDGDSMRAGLQDTLIAWSTAPYDPLRVLAMDPASGETGVARDRGVSLAFNRPVRLSSVTSEALYVTDSWGLLLAGAVQAAETGDTLRWLPTDVYWYASACTVHATCDILDRDGKPLDQDAQTYPDVEPFSAAFSTVEQPLGPRVIAVSPADGAGAVARGSVVRVTFNEPVDPSSVRPETTFRLLRDGQVGVPGSITADASQTVFTLRPSADLAPGQVYSVVVRAELSGGAPGVVDLEGIRLDQDRSARGYQSFASTFQVEAPPSVTLVFAPARPDTFVAADVSALLAFSHDIDPASVTPDRVQLRREGSAVSAALTLEDDHRNARLTPATPLVRLTRHSVWVDTLVAGVDGSLLDGDPLLAGRQPFERFFTTEPESLHPRVTGVHPLAGDTAAAASDSMRISFSIPVDPATVDAGTFTLHAVSGGGALAGTISADRWGAVLRPANGLDYLTEYEIRAGTGILSETRLFALDQDPAEPGLQAFASRFRTDQERVSPRIVASEPGANASDVSRATVVRLTFSEAVDGGSAAAGFSMRAGEDEVVGSGVLDGAGVVWTFTPAEPLGWDRSCTVVVDTVVADLAGNRLDQVPATSARDPFELSFRTEADRIAPRVLWSDPSDEASGVPIDALVRIGFSEPLAPASVQPGAVRVMLEGTAVAGRLALLAGDSVITWSPVQMPDSLAAVLEEGARYTVTADTLLEDPQGNRLDQEVGVSGRQAFTLNFNTILEHVSPKVVAFLPGTVDVPTDTTLAVVFSEPMNTASLEAPGVVALTPQGGEPVEMLIEISASAETLFVHCLASLSHDRNHRLTVDTLATDVAGNPLDQDLLQSGAQPYAIDFRTEIDWVRPIVISVTPLDEAEQVSLDTAVELLFSEPLSAATVTGESVLLLGPHGQVPLAGDGQPELDAAHTRITLYPAGDLEEASVYGVHVTPGVTDVNGNGVQPPFASEFSTGWRPRIVWAGGACMLGESPAVLFDAHTSYDPDGGDAVVWAVWTWGDGASDSVAAPAGLIAAHEYACQDTAGCDGLDNDSDGRTDEDEGEGACDESYRIVLTLTDGHGYTASDTAGVSFCAFVARATRPAAGDTAAAEDSVRIFFTRPVDPATLDAALDFVRLPDSVAVACARLWEDGGRTLVLVPEVVLGATAYRVTLSAALGDTEGSLLDQEPCAAGRQGFSVEFTGPPALGKERARAGGAFSPPDRPTPDPGAPMPAAPGPGPRPRRSAADPRR